MKLTPPKDVDPELYKKNFIDGLLKRFHEEGSPAYFDPEKSKVYCTDKNGKILIGFEITL